MFRTALRAAPRVLSGSSRIAQVREDVRLRKRASMVLRLSWSELSGMQNCHWDASQQLLELHEDFVPMPASSEDLSLKSASCHSDEPLV